MFPELFCALYVHLTGKKAYKKKSSTRGISKIQKSARNDQTRAEKEKKACQFEVSKGFPFPLGRSALQGVACTIAVAQSTKISFISVIVEEISRTKSIDLWAFWRYRLLRILPVYHCLACFFVDRLVPGLVLGAENRLRTAAQSLKSSL